MLEIGLWYCGRLVVVAAVVVALMHRLKQTCCRMVTVLRFFGGVGSGGGGRRRGRGEGGGGSGNRVQ